MLSTVLYRKYSRYDPDTPGDEQARAKGHLQADAVAGSSTPDRSPRGHPNLCNTHVLRDIQAAGDHQRCVGRAGDPGETEEFI